MRILHLFTVLTVIYLTTAAPSKSKFETGTDSDSVPFVEEVVVESVLHVRAPTDRQGRTNTNTNLQGSTHTNINLQNGARVAGAKP